MLAVVKQFGLILVLLSSPIHLSCFSSSCHSLCRLFTPLSILLPSSFSIPHLVIPLQPSVLLFLFSIVLFPFSCSHRSSLSSIHPSIPPPLFLPPSFLPSSLQIQEDSGDSLSGGTEDQCSSHHSGHGHQQETGRHEVWCSRAKKQPTLWLGYKKKRAEQTVSKPKISHDRFIFIWSNSWS